MPGSGDLLADRRYDYGAAVLAEGDAAAAADLARQALELAPDFAAAWFLLGEASEAAFRKDEHGPEADALRRDAVAAYETALASDPDDPQGARLRLAGLGIGDPLAAMGATYVRGLFDDYAARFDRHLVRSLGYRGPELIVQALRRACSRLLRPCRFAVALDLGCGTGLAGEALRGACDRLDGIDLSAAMVDRARRKRVYDALEVGDLAAWLATRPPAAADLAVAADVLVYVADLAPAFAGVARALAHGGLFAFTAQASAHNGVVLGSDLRYAHGHEHLRGLAAAHGFTVVLLEACSTREDRGRPVPGWLAVLEKQPN